MYEIIAMDNTGKECVIYNDKANNTDYKVENPKLIIAEDTAGSLNFKIPPTHPHYDALDPMKTLLKVIREDKCIWAGRITELHMDFWDQKEVTCEGVLGFLNDTVQEPGILKDTVAYDPKKILQLIINRHNTQIQKADGGVPNKHKTFTVGVVNVYENPNDALTPDDEDTNWYTDWNTSWDALNQILFERYPKGHLRCQWRKDDGETEESWHLDYISQENYSTSEQTIEFGKNLIDFTRNYTMTDLKTVCLPRGSVLEDQSEYIEGLNRRLGVTTVNNIANGESSDYNDQFIRITQAVPDSTALEDMGWIVQEVVWDEVSDKTKLKKRAKKWLREEQFDNMVIEINAVDLHYLNPSIESADILTKIRCISKPHGMDREFPITKIEIVLDKPESSKITLGSSKQRSFTGSTVGKNRDTDKEISDIWKKLDNFVIPEPGPAEIVYPSWENSSWIDVYKAIQLHHSGGCDLYRDYGWRIGDKRSLYLLNDQTWTYTDKNGNSVSYTIPKGAYDAVLINRGGKKIEFYDKVERYQSSYTSSGVTTLWYDVNRNQSKKTIKECAFVVALFPIIGSRVQPYGTPIDETNNYNKAQGPEIWPNCWMRTQLNRLIQILNLRKSTYTEDESVISNRDVTAERIKVNDKTYRTVSYYRDVIFSPMVNTYVDDVTFPYSKTVQQGTSSSNYRVEMTIDEWNSHKASIVDEISMLNSYELYGRGSCNFYDMTVDEDVYFAPEEGQYIARSYPDSVGIAPYDQKQMDIMSLYGITYKGSALANYFKDPNGSNYCRCWTRSVDFEYTKYNQLYINSCNGSYNSVAFRNGYTYQYIQKQSPSEGTSNSWSSANFVVPILCI